MDSDVARTTVLITGASAGIGRELVPFFAGTGHNVVLVGREKPVLEGIAAAARKVFRVKASVIACDLAEPDGARTVFAELLQRKIDIDILVNDAGVNRTESLLRPSCRSWSELCRSISWR
jgi:short-subunit dehydrogenase